MDLAPILTPHASLMLGPAGEALAVDSKRGARLEQAFARGSGHGLLHLGIDEVGHTLPPVLSYWRELAARYVTSLCALPDIGEGGIKPAVPLPADGEFDKLAAAVPPMTGAEYLTAAVLAELWRGMDAAFDTELARHLDMCLRQAVSLFRFDPRFQLNELKAVYVRIEPHIQRQCHDQAGALRHSSGHYTDIGIRRIMP